MEQDWGAALLALRDAAAELSMREQTAAHLELAAVAAAGSACALSGVESESAQDGYRRGYLALATAQVREVTLDSLRALNQLLLANTAPAGAGRARPRSSALLRAGRVALFPPPRDTAHSGLAAACAAVRTELAHDAISPWILASRLHLECARAQLFFDANGRLGMLAARLVLAQSGALLQAALPIEQVHLERATEYWQLLQQAMRSRDAVDEWHTFNLQCYVRAAQIALAR